MRYLGQRLYYGWFVLAAVAGLNFANGATTIGVLTVFILPLTEAFGWTRTQISVVTSVGAVLGALTASFMGRVTDRFGARLPLTLGGVCIVLALLYLAHVTMNIYDVRGTIGANVEKLSSALLTGADCDNFRCETK